MSKFVDKIVDWLQSNNLVNDSNKDFVKYGLKQAIFNFIFILIQIVLYVYFDKILDGILFLISFIFLRKYAGGYHANSRLSCFIFSNMLSICYIFISNIDLSIKLEITMFVVAVAILLIICPVDNINKKLEHNEYIKYKKYMIIIIFVEIIAFVLAVIFNIALVKISLMYSIIFVSLLAILGYIKKISYKIGKKW